MRRVSAFVGHSFDEADMKVVRAFLDYLTTIKKSPEKNFDWDHAQEAQPMAISQKVIEKIKGKDLFIGICTKKERVIKDSLLTEGKWINRNKLLSDESNFEWKTSDWVLQELGYCLGQGMSSILLLEKGVRPLSGLQADLEYIIFDRDNPSAAFHQLLQQINSTSFVPAEGELQLQGDDSLAVVSQADKEIKEGNSEYWKTPNENWDYTSYWIALYIAISNKELQTGDLIYKHHMDKLGSGTKEAIIWQAEYCLLKQKYQNESAITPIKNLIDKYPLIPELHIKLSRAYQEYQSFGLALTEADIAISNNEEFDVDHVVMKAELLEKTKGSGVAREFLRTYLSKTEINDNIKYELLKAYGEFHKKDIPLVYCALFEAALTLRPDNSSLRFDLAYQYSELNLHKSAVHHYKILTKTNPSSANLNNLGVSYDRLNIDTKSVECYQKSSDIDGTLAMSNLASKLIKSGFSDQATELCKKAMKLQDFDSRVTSTLESINTKIESDNKLDLNISSDTKEQREFLIAFANALSSVEIHIQSGIYRHQECNLEISITGTDFKAFGVYEKEVDRNRLAIWSGLSGGPKEMEVVCHKITYLGKIYGNGIIAKLFKKSDKPSGLLGSSESEVEVLIYYSLYENCFYVSESSKSGNQENPYKLLPVHALNP